MQCKFCGNAANASVPVCWDCAERRRKWLDAMPDVTEPAAWLAALKAVVGAAEDCCLAIQEGELEPKDDPQQVLQFVDRRLGLALEHLRASAKEGA